MGCANPVVNGAIRRAGLFSALWFAVPLPVNIEHSLPPLPGAILSTWYAFAWHAVRCCLGQPDFSTPLANGIYHPVRRVPRVKCTLLRAGHTKARYY